jgi:THO complex subunit 4
MDMALDDMVNSSRKARRPGGRGGRRGSAREDVLGKAPASPVTRARAAAQTAAPAGGQGFATKIVVSNLPVDVNEAQIKELFSATIGPLREVNLSYDANGKSKGIAQVHFQRKGDGNKAYAEYNNRLIDGS